MNNINIVDIALIFITILGAVQGFISGMIVGLVSILGIIITVFFYTSFSSAITNMLYPFVDNHKMLPYLTTAIMLISMTTISMITGKIAQKALHSTSFGIVDKILGSIFGGLKWFFIAIALFWMISMSNNNVKENYYNKSITCESVNPLLEFVINKIESGNEELSKKNQENQQRLRRKKKYKYSKPKRSKKNKKTDES